MFLKKQAKKSIFAPKIALRVEHSDPARKPYFPANFLSARLQCSRLLHNCGKFLHLKGLSHEIDFKNVDENGQILALLRAAAGF